MGFIDALYVIGKAFSSNNYDFSDYLTLPTKVGKSKEIRIYLKLANYTNNQKDITPLKIIDISKIDEVDFFAGNETDEEKKIRYLYKDPPESNTTWKYSPVLKIAKPKDDKEKNRKYFLQGNTAPINKIEKMLNEFEKMGYFEKGSTSKIVEKLKDKLDQILCCYTDKNSNYLIVFGVDKEGDFIYPGKMTVFRKYFEEKLKSHLNEKKVTSKGNKNEKKCDYCGKSSGLYTFDQVFPFATFDKPNFLPAINKNFNSKIFNICEDCLKIFLKSKDYVQANFTDNSIIFGITIWVIPEFFTLNENKLDPAFSNLNNYISTDQHSKEENLLDYITDSSLVDDPYTAVFHFLFLETNQSQLIVHQMIEDVPITRIRKLQEIWKTTVKDFEKSENANIKLSYAFKKIHISVKNLVLKEETEEKVMRNLVIGIIGKLLSGERVNTKILKQYFVSRIPKLMNEKTKKGNFYFILNDFLLINEFLNNYNNSLGVII